MKLEGQNQSFSLSSQLCWVIGGDMGEPPWDSVRGCLFMKYVRFMENDEKDVVKHLYEVINSLFH